MINFRGAVKDQVEGIEFDVWLSKDNVLMVMHGGRDGDLGQYDLPDDRVFDWTCKQLKSVDIGQGESMPTLEEVIKVALGAPNM